MGACTSNSNRLETQVDKNETLDFESFREKIRENGDAKIFEVKAKLWELIQVNPKFIKKILISKYLFFKPNATFESRIGKNLTSEENVIEGFLNKNGEIKIQYKQKVLDKNAVKVKYYEGKVVINDKGFICSGKVYESNEIFGEERIEKPECFILNFPSTLWKLDYIKKNKQVIQINTFLRYKNNLFSGISSDDKGYSVWAGLERNENKVTLVQQYMDKDYVQGSPNMENGTYSYSGIIDKNIVSIEGIVNGIDLENQCPFNLKFIDKLNKPKKKIES